MTLLIIDQFLWSQLLLKYLEKLIVSQLNNYCEENGLLSPYQGAYHCGRSTKQIILLAVDTIVNVLDCRKLCVLLSLTLGRHLTHCTTLCCWNALVQLVYLLWQSQLQLVSRTLQRFHQDWMIFEYQNAVACLIQYRH